MIDGYTVRRCVEPETWSCGMPITVTWYDEQKTYLLITFIGKWSVEDCLQMLDESERLSRSATRSFATVVDYSGSGFPPANLIDIRHRMRELNTSRYYAGDVIINPSSIIKIVHGMFKSLLRFKSEYATSMDEALHLADKLIVEHQLKLSNR